MIFYIINIAFIIGISYFEYKRFSLIKEKCSLIKEIKNISKSEFRYYYGSWKNESRDGDYRWKVYLTLSEEIKSSDGKMTKFIVKDVISENKKDTIHHLEDYKNDFYGSTGGGWLKTNDTNLLKYEPIDIWEKRKEKLEELGI